MLRDPRTQPWTSPWRLVFTGAIASTLCFLALSAYSISSTWAQQPHVHNMSAAPMHEHITSSTPAAQFRTTLNLLLQEHVYLAGAATGAALGNRPAEFEAAANALDGNSIQLAQAIGSVYGASAEQTFLALWRAHIGMFVDYTMGVAANDQMKKDQAVADLNGYRRDFDAFITGANPNVPPGVVADLLVDHVLTLANAVEAQGAGDPVTAYAWLKTAAEHMPHLADPLAEAIVKQYPERFEY